MAVNSFLEEPDSVLDAGYSLPLKADAMAQGSIVAAKAFLLSDEIQEELRQLILEASATSLEVERKHQQEGRGAKNVS